MKQRHSLPSPKYETRNKIQVAQREMKYSMLGISIRDRLTNKEICLQTRNTVDISRIIFLKWNWAAHIARTIDNRWTKKFLK